MAEIDSLTTGRFLKSFYVYTHHRADNGEVFYVGCATKHRRKRGVKAPYQRAYDFTQRTPAWFKVAGEAGGVRVVFVLETNNQEKAWATERTLIAQYGRQDLDRGFLVNQTDGGLGFCRIFFGESNSAAKVSSDDILRIRSEYARGGISQRALGKKYSFSQGHVSDIVNRVKWATDSARAAIAKAEGQS